MTNDDYAYGLSADCGVAPRCTSIIRPPKTSNAAFTTGSACAAFMSACVTRRGSCDTGSAMFVGRGRRAGDAGSAVGFGGVGAPCKPVELLIAAAGRGAGGADRAISRGCAPPSTICKSDSMDENFAASAKRMTAASTRARPLPLDRTLRRNSSSTVIMYTKAPASKRCA